MTALSVRLEKRLEGFHLDVAFEAGSGITVLFGPSGAGKSATLAAIAGALRPDQGRIALGQTVFHDTAAGVDLRPEKRGVGWVFQDARLFPHLSVEQNLRYGLKRVGRRPAPLEFEAVSKVLGLGALLARRPRDLSGGEAQRVSLGRALLIQPRLLLMDEPLSGLDGARKGEILTFIEEVRDAFAIPMLYVTHSLGETARLADRLVLIQAGRVTAEGAPAALFGRPDLPLLGGRGDAAALIDGVVSAHPPGGGTLVRAGKAVWACGAVPRPVGAAVRLVVLARDVIVAVSEPVGLSARNTLPGVLDRLTPRLDGTVLAHLNVGGMTILSSVTTDAVERLALRPGLAVWAVVKSAAVEGAERGGLSPFLDD